MKELEKIIKSFAVEEQDVWFIYHDNFPILAQTISDWMDRKGYIKPTEDKELKEIIKNKLDGYEYQDGYSYLACAIYDTKEASKEIATAITSAGYIKKSNIVLDEEKILDFILKYYPSQNIDECDISRRLAKYIAEHKKEIMK